VELDPERIGYFKIFSKAPVLNHETSIFSKFGSKSHHYCSGFDGGIGPHHVKDLRIPLGPRFQITKHLNLAILAQGTKCFCGYFDF
jgi:hypothetical protein